LTRSKQPEEREFYLRMATQNRWQVREVARQIDSQLFARSILNPPQVSTTLREIEPKAGGFFKDSYILDFLGLPITHSEADLHRGLLNHMGRFLTELGSDFCYVGSEYPYKLAVRILRLICCFFIAVLIVC
jgi:predicted nuclease of restriction endonuclease-like (RecB) superfamily